jgi:hypothetical protein
MSSATHEPKEATYEDLLALPDDVIGELIDGALIVSPRPAAPHTLAASSLEGPPRGALSVRAGRAGGVVAPLRARAAL